MSPAESEAFEAGWATVAPEVEALLAKRGVDPATREDLVQETALRLFDRWDRIDKTRPLLPLAATIAMNLLRDRWRRGRHEIPLHVEAAGPTGDVEREGIARLELRRVATAMNSLSRSHRDVLLASISDASFDLSRKKLGPSEGVATPLPFDDASSPPRSAAATKMLRMRARRRLLALLEATGVAVATIRLRLHQMFNESAHTTAAAFAAGALIAGSFTIPADQQGRRIEFGEGRIASHEGRGGPQVELSVAGPARRSGSIEGGVIVAGGLKDPSASSSVAEPGTRDPDVEAEADVQVDPTGETVVEVNAGIVVVKAHRSPDDDYSTCVAVAMGASSEKDCDEEDDQGS